MTVSGWKCVCHIHKTAAMTSILSLFVNMVYHLSSEWPTEYTIDDAVISMDGTVINCVVQMISFLVATTVPYVTQCISYSMI